MGKLRCGNCYKNVEQEDLIELNEYAWKCPHCHKRLLSVDKNRYIDWLESRNKQLQEELKKELGVRIKYQEVVYEALSLLDPSGQKVTVGDTINVLRSKLKGGGE